MRVTRNIHGFAVATAALVIALGGCSDTTQTAPEVVNEDGTAVRFVACLTAGGVSAKISDSATAGDQGLVVVEDPSAQLETESGSVDSGVSSGEPPLAILGEGDGSTWVAAQSAQYFTHAPQTQKVYADCEADFPSFSQSVGQAGDDPELQKQLALQAEHGLQFARCARDAGFEWVGDPAGESGTTQAIELPTDVNQEEFTSALETCMTSDLNVVWSVPGEPSFDWQKVLQDFVPADQADAQSYEEEDE